MANVSVHESIIRRTVMFIAKLQGRSNYSPKRTWLYTSLLKAMWINQKAAAFGPGWLTITDGATVWLRLCLVSPAWSTSYYCCSIKKAVLIMFNVFIGHNWIVLLLKVKTSGTHKEGTIYYWSSPFGSNSWNWITAVWKGKLAFLWEFSRLSSLHTNPFKSN